MGEIKCLEKIYTNMCFKLLYAALAILVIFLSYVINQSFRWTVSGTYRHWPNSVGYLLQVHTVWYHL